MRSTTLPRIPTQRTHPTMRSRQTRHHRLRQACRNHPHRLHRQQLPCPRSPRRRQSRRDTPPPSCRQHSQKKPNRKQQHGSSSTRRNSKAHAAEQERRAEEFKQQQELAGAASTRQHRPKRDGQRKARQATFDRIIENAPAMLHRRSACAWSFAQSSTSTPTPSPTIWPRTSPPTTRTRQRSPEELLLATIDTTADAKLTAFALRLALSGHVCIPREKRVRLSSPKPKPFSLAPKPKNVSPARLRIRSRRWSSRIRAYRSRRAKVAKKQIAA